MVFRIGTRKSPLALAQTSEVVGKIKFFFPDLALEIIEITTKGDKIKDRPLYDIGGKALFLKELEEALLAGAVDMAIHSLKDVPGEISPDLPISATLERLYPFDVFFSKKFKNIKELGANNILGTSSPRREAFARAAGGGFEIKSIRGNVDSRVGKVLSGEFCATILAEAGLRRLGLYDPSYCFKISPEELVPAVGQGVICTQIRAGDPLAEEISGKINHKGTWEVSSAERSFLKALKADCKTPLGAYARFNGAGKMEADFFLLSPVGRIFREKAEFSPEGARAAGENMALRFLAEIKW